MLQTLNTRRGALSKIAVVGAAITAGTGMGSVATCSSTGGVVINPDVIDAIQKAVATACGFVPAVSTLVAIVAASFPAVAGVATIADTVLEQIAALLCTAYTSAQVSGQLKGVPMAGTVPIHGLHVVNGKIVAF
jgi:hypothetical protein